MGRSRGWDLRAVGVAVLLLTLCCGGRTASAVNVFQNASITLDSLVLSVPNVAADCQQNWNAGSLTNCGTLSSGAHAEFVAGTGLRGAVFSLANSGNFSQTAGSGLF